MGGQANLSETVPAGGRATNIRRLSPIKLINFDNMSPKAQPTDGMTAQA